MTSPYTISLNRVLLAPGIALHLGRHRNFYNMLEYGRQLRDGIIWEYPSLPGALQTFRQMAETREFKVSGTIRGAPRAIEYLNNATSANYNGAVDIGFQTWRSRRINDYTIVGMTSFFWREDEPLQYLDPTNLRYNLKTKKYTDIFTGIEYPAKNVVIHKPNPIGKHGDFVSPVYPVIPKAILAWLIAEHDQARIDGRKVRDIKIVASEDLAEQIASAIEDSVKLWVGADPTKYEVPVVHVDWVQGMPAIQDLIGTLGLSELPANLDRNQFEFSYANEISSNLGLALRAWWNSERATNRALEEIQEYRQTAKGPSAEVRTEQRLIQNSGCLKQFGPNTRMGFIEEVDSGSREVDAKVIKLYSEALEAFARVFGGEVNGEAFLSWLQSEDILPHDIDLIVDIGMIQNPDELPSNTEETPMLPSEVPPSSGIAEERSLQMIARNIHEALNGNGSVNKSHSDLLDYGEITMDQNGRILEMREKSFAFPEVFSSYLSQEDFKIDPKNTFDEALKRARVDNFDRFKSLFGQIDDERKERINVKANFESLQDGDHRLITIILREVDIKENALASN